MGGRDPGHLVQLFLVQHCFDPLPHSATATIRVQSLELAQRGGESCKVVGTRLDLVLDLLGKSCPPRPIALGQLL